MRRTAVRSAMTMSSTSSTRHNRLRTEGGAQWGSSGESSARVDAEVPTFTEPPVALSVKSTM